MYIAPPSSSSFSQVCQQDRGEGRVMGRVVRAEEIVFTMRKEDG